MVNRDVVVGRFVAETVPRGNQVSGSFSVGPSLDVTSHGRPERSFSSLQIFLS